MLLFVCCSKCREAIEARDILDVCQYLEWKCPKCGEWNNPLGTEDAEEITFGESDGEILGGVAIEITNDIIDPENMKNNILEEINHGD